MKVSKYGQITYEEEANRLHPEGCTEGNNSGGDCPWCQVYYGWACPACGEPDVIPADEGKFAYCESCGFVQYDEWTLSIQREAKREYEEAKRFYYPDPVPDYRTWVEDQAKRRD